MIDAEKCCMQCMMQMQSAKGICPFCGCDNALVENEPHQLECGSILAGTYLVGKTLGQGGFGITYVAWDLNLNTKVAIKEYYPEGYVSRNMSTRTSVLTYTGEKDTVFQKGKERFISEAKTLAMFKADNGVVNVRSFFLENGTAYIVMDFVEGETLKRHVTRCGGKLDTKEALKLFEPLFTTLDAIHKAELLHRDISPDNIILRPNGTLVLLDFGASRQMSIAGEHSNTVNVKHGYAPEEQYRTRGEQGPWTDIYALAATIYRLTTGITPPQALDRIADETILVPPTKIGADFTPTQESAILHALAVRACDRTQTITAFREELYEGKVDVVKKNNTQLDVQENQPEVRISAQAELFKDDQENATQTKGNRHRVIRAKNIAFVLFALLGFVVVAIFGYLFVLNRTGMGEAETPVELQSATNTPKLYATPMESPIATEVPSVMSTPEPAEAATIGLINSWSYTQNGYEATLSTDGEIWTAQLSGVNIKDSYNVNFKEQYHGEYTWEIDFEIKNDEYTIQTAYYSGLIASKNKVSINEMQTELLKKAEESADGLTISYMHVSDAELMVEGDTLTWTFNLPVQIEPNEVGIVAVIIYEGGKYVIYNERGF